MPSPLIPYRGLNDLGGFFSLSPIISGAGWRSGAELVADLDDAVEDYLDRLRTDRADIAGSLLVQGWAARLTAVHLGSIALTGTAPDLAAEAVDVRLPARGTLEVHPRTAGLVDADAAWRRLADGHLSPLIDAVHTSCRSGRRRLWGNVAAVRAGAVVELRRNGFPSASPEPMEVVRLGRWVRPHVYARTTCCGLVRIPGRAACGDCVLRFRPSGRAAAEELP
ncbi:MAG: hypothetical protein H0T85_09535 [Geodermatophilaceae bacterium]|nr:hypothetical protein [Geodermatophilaceae bacterium]